MEFCTATLNYFARPDAGQRPGATAVSILDGRTADLPGWEVCGFELMSQRSAVTDWNDDDEIARVHYPELTELARKLTGCDHALLGAHIRRNPDEAQRHRDLSPIPVVHSDFADSYGDLIREAYRRGDRVVSVEHDEITAEDVAGARRIAIVQFWRNIGPPKMDMPLAFCDARTVPRSELVTFPVNNYAGSGFSFEALGVMTPDASSTHAWYAFPEMTIDEVVAFRTYDSDLVASGGAFWTPHSAFNDPEVEPGKPSRASIELRPTCIWL